MKFLTDDLERAAKAWDEASILQKNLIAACAIFLAVLLVEFSIWGGGQF